jgi:YD repeat-containing protein
MPNPCQLPNRLARYATCSVAFVFFLSGLTLTPVWPARAKVAPQNRSGQTNKGKRVEALAPLPGPPAGNLPNLNEVRHRQPQTPAARPPAPSTLRSKHKPLESRHGRKVGDPLPTPSPSPRQSPSPTRSPSPTPTPTPIQSPTPRPGPSRTPTPSPTLIATFSDGLTPADSLSSIRSFRGGLLPANEKLRLAAGLVRLLSNEWRTSLPSKRTGLLLLDHPALGFLRYSTLDASNYPPATPTGRGSDSADFDLFSSPVPQGGNSKIVFASNRDGSTQIYVMNSDGTGQTRLTNNASNDDHPRWSPNGARILFQSDRDNPDTGYLDIYVMNADGSGVTRLTTDANDDSAAVWSPDGTKIAFQSRRNGSYYQVYVMNADGSGQTNLSNSETDDGEPSWSADGTKIAFTRDLYNNGEQSIYVMTSSGGNQTRLTFNGTDSGDEQPSWSPDGSRIAFVSTRDSTVVTWQETDDDGNVITKSKVIVNKEVYMMNADGSNQTRLTNADGDDDAPGWSPGGTKLIFRSDRERDCCDPTSQLWMMNPDGSNQINLSNNGAGDYSASWTTSGNQSPTANAGGAYSGVVTQAINFNGGGSFDSDGSIVSYAWSFGDGYNGSGATPTHSYAGAGTYTVTLTVTDNSGAQGSASTSATISTSTADVYTQNFYQWAVLRQPSADETNYWEDIFRAAYAHGNGAMTIAVREMGRTLFESAEYAGRERNNHWYVYDLYKSYLMRDPDSDGWAYWESVVPSQGRDAVRRAFDLCGEFAYYAGAITPDGLPSSNVSSLLTARVDPNNQTGNQLQARDAEWNVSLLSLPGRAGLDLGLGLSYSSSAVWTRSGPYLYFDEDNGSPSPGFRLGFPTVQEKFFDAQVGTNVYLLITPSGHRVELRQVGSSNIYDAADSSYLQLTDNGGSLMVRSPDGTQMSYTPRENDWRCTGIEDRNGNYVTINYQEWRDDIASIVDTLSRTLTFNYDSNNNLISITQPWTVNGQSQTHTWATFGWDTLQMQPSSSGAQVSGTYNGETIPVLSQVSLADGSYFTFNYIATGQVNIIRRYTNDNVQQSATIFNYQAQDDSTQLSNIHLSALNWTGINGMPSEVVTQFGIEGDAHTLTVVGDPNSTVYKEHYGVIGSSPAWQRGLPISSEVWSGGAQQKVTTTSWTQDNINLPYAANPRVIEMNVIDSAGNHSRTTIGYYSFTLPDGTSCNLPNQVDEYQADATTIARRTHTDYNLSPSYLNRWLLGLLQAKMIYEGATTLAAKTTYLYDAGGEYLQDTPNEPAQHDPSYDTQLTAGRGNLVDVLRWDINDPDNGSKALESKSGYNIGGSVIFARDALNHQSTLGYGDSFSDGVNTRHSFAYPTTMTDADSNSSYVQYNFDFGAKTRVQGPPPAGQSQGVVQTFAYDNAARIQQVTTTNTGAYTRYEYGPYFTQSFGSVNNLADEAYSLQLFDGAGHVFANVTGHAGSVGGYSTQMTYYDVMGRAVKQSNPTEMNGYWAPAGDDAAGWIYTQQTYDWKGRPLITTNTDGTQKSVSYSACGCAGSAVTTLTDEMGRQQKVYSDVLGRTAKTEVLDWEGNVYSSRTIAYNARDQITFTRQYQGTESSGIYQEVTQTFDGYGRLATHQDPIQAAPISYTYYANDKPLAITDARGATSTFTYNNRGLTTGISYGGPSPVPAPVGIAYDAAGNRTSMSDGTGNVSYAYNSLSEMTSETRQFSGLSGNFTLAYEYTLLGQLKSITDPVGSRVDYSYDGANRLTSATGSGPISASVYAFNFGYRASGAVKDFDFGNGVHQHLDFNSRLQNTALGLSNIASSGSVSWTNQYYADGKLSTVSDSADSRFDRAFDYDHVGRISNALTGSEARGANTADGPFRQSYSYDAWENSVGRTYRVWTQATQTENVSYTSNRHQSWQYNNQGQLTGDYDASYGYDAAGRQNSFTSYATVGNNPERPALEVAQTFDGNNAPARKISTSRTQQYVGDQLQVQESVTTNYYLRATPLGGQVVAELDNTGYKRTGYIFVGGMRIARQDVWNPGYGGQVFWLSTNPETGSEYSLDSAGNMGRKELDPLGTDVTNPPDPALISEPSFYDPKFNLMPIEYTGGPSEYFQEGMAWYEGQLNAAEHYDENVKIAAALGDLWQSNRSAAENVLAHNPNIGVTSLSSGITRWGAEAADFLHRLDMKGVDVQVEPDGAGDPQKRGTAFRDSQKSVISQSFDDVLGVLKNDKNCAKFFGAINKQGLNNLIVTVLSLQSGAKFDPTLYELAQTEGKGRNATIYIGGYFFIDGTFAAAFHNRMQPRPGRAETILHEIGHALRRIPNDDARDRFGQAVDNDKIIMKNCAKGLAALN